MLVLAEVAEVVVDGQAALAHPGERVVQPPLRDPQPGPHRRDRPHVRGEVAGVDALGLGEQVERAGEVPVGLPEPGHRDPPAVRVLRQAGVLAELPAAQQVLGGRPSRSSRSRSSAAMPTCMSAAPRSTAAACAVAACSPRS